MAVTARYERNPVGEARQFQVIARRRLSRITRGTATQARADVPVKTGNLGRSIREDPIVVAGPLRLDSGVTAHADYARYVHDGTRAHVIRPRRPGGVLRFTVGGRVVYARRVNHPGTRARPFLRNAAERVVARETATS
ncbi:tail assembly chaperone [Mycobacterium phage Bernardo]|uniref:Tail assembly chaperone n=1 Tax=Mycobacterium phage Bernardo TaxID=1429903 RepID=V5R949_9CAUD|nr:tail assembly chaperone [Mycobacterium phage Bernardo]AHB31703.1 tail assembly chaperone [Mycobacterium phage Bernardo]